MRKRSFGVLQSFECEERLRETGFHIEDAGAIRFSAGNTERHFGQRAGGVDRVVMSEHQKLARGPGFLRPPGYAQLIAAEFLRDALDVCAALAPFRGENVAAAIGGSLLKAGRFRQDKPLGRRKHLRQTIFQLPQEFFGVVGVRHGRDMLTMTGSGSKRRAGELFR
jgi:hypothetical protein